MAIIKQLKDGAETEEWLPVTNTKAVYDDDGNRLDNTLTSINESLVDVEESLANVDITDKITLSSGCQLFSAVKNVNIVDIYLLVPPNVTTIGSISDKYRPYMQAQCIGVGDGAVRGYGIILNNGTIACTAYSSNMYLHFCYITKE